MADLAEPAAVTIHYFKKKVALAAFVEQGRKNIVNLKEFLLSFLSVFRKYMFSKRRFHHK